MEGPCESPNNLLQPRALALLGGAVVKDDRGRVVVLREGAVSWVEKGDTQSGYATEGMADTILVGAVARCSERGFAPSLDKQSGGCGWFEDHSSRACADPRRAVRLPLCVQIDADIAGYAGKFGKTLNAAGN